MGGKNKQRQYEDQARQAEEERARQASELQNGAEVTAYKNRIGARRKAIDTGNISGATDFIGNSANQALIARKREAEFSATPTGVQAIGERYANPNQIAMQSKMLKDMQARDSAGQLESDWGNYINDTQAMEAGLLSRNDGIGMALMSNAQQRSSNYEQFARQIEQQRHNMYAGLIGAGIGAAGSIFSGGFSQGGRL